MSIAATYDMYINQFDIETTFFYGKISEDIYMNQSQGFVHPIYPNKVYKLSKSLYGLKQPSRV